MPEACPDGFKRCSCCGECKPATPEFFVRNNHKRSGLHSRCRVCQAKIDYERYWSDPERERARKQKYRDENRDKINEDARRYRAENPQKSLESVQRYRARNSARVKQYDRDYRRVHKEQNRLTNSRFHVRHPYKNTEYHGRRKARKLNLPDTLTEIEWECAVNYFNGRCAVCGRQLRDLFGTHTIAADHWIPLTSPACPGTVATNMIPLCHGQNGCNNSKHDRDAKEWLTERYGNRKARTILARIESYFQWVREQGGT